MDHKINWPRITIITPSYNQGEFIEETIKSVLNQKYPNLEYFIVDGGSTDNTLDIIRKYEDKIDWWVSEPDRGQSHAINKGLARATGEVMNWINSDDLLFPGALKLIAEAYRNHAGKVDLITGAIARISAEGRILKISWPPCPRAIFFRHLVIPLGQQSTFFTRKAIESFGCVKEDLHAIMDADLFYRVFKKGGKLVRVKGLIGAIRNHARAKGFARIDLWEKERPIYWGEIGLVPSLKKIDLIKMRTIRIMDGSYLKSFILTKLNNNNIINGDGVMHC